MDRRCFAATSRGWFDANTRSAASKRPTLSNYVSSNDGAAEGFGTRYEQRWEDEGVRRSLSLRPSTEREARGYWPAHGEAACCAEDALPVVAESRHSNSRAATTSATEDAQKMSLMASATTSSSRIDQQRRARPAEIEENPLQRSVSTFNRSDSLLVRRRLASPRVEWRPLADRLGGSVMMGRDQLPASKSASLSALPAGDAVEGTSERDCQAGKQLKLFVRHCRGDGNCAFRAFSDQLYGGQSYHLMIRHCAVALMKLYRSHFAPFVDKSQAASFEEYVRNVACDAVWADDMELQAVSMLYRRRIEVYDKNFNLMRTLHEEDAPAGWGNKKAPFRLMYEGGHYCSVVKEADVFPLVSTRPGKLEAWLLANDQRKWCDSPEPAIPLLSESDCTSSESSGDASSCGETAAHSRSPAREVSGAFVSAGCSRSSVKRSPMESSSFSRRPISVNDAALVVSPDVVNELRTREKDGQPPLDAEGPLHASALRRKKKEQCESETGASLRGSSKMSSCPSESPFSACRRTTCSSTEEVPYPEKRSLIRTAYPPLRPAQSQPTSLCRSSSSSLVFSQSTTKTHQPPIASSFATHTTTTVPQQSAYACASRRTGEQKQQTVSAVFSTRRCFTNDKPAGQDVVSWREDDMEWYYPQPQALPLTLSSQLPTFPDAVRAIAPPPAPRNSLLWKRHPVDTAGLTLPLLNNCSSYSSSPSSSSPGFTRAAAVAPIQRSQVDIHCQDLFTRPCGSALLQPTESTAQRHSRIRYACQQPPAVVRPISAPTSPSRLAL